MDCNLHTLKGLRLVHHNTLSLWAGEVTSFFTAVAYPWKGNSYYAI